MGATPTLATLPHLDPSGKPASLRLILPPNLATAAQRDAIAVRIEIGVDGRKRFPAGRVPFDPALNVPATHLSALFLVESWNAGRPTAFAQLSREQLAALLVVLLGEPIFFDARKPTQPLSWSGNQLAGVSEHLAKAVTANVATEADSVATGLRACRPPPPVSDRQGRLSLHDSAKLADVGPPMVDGSEHFLAVQLPSREHPAYNEILELLKAESFRLEPSNRKWWLRDRARTLRFLAAHWHRLEQDWGAEFTDNFQRNTAKIARAEINCDITKTGDGFDVALAVEAGSAPERQINAALATNRGFVESENRIFLLDRARLEKLQSTQRILAGQPDALLLGKSRHRVSAHAVAETDEALAALSPNLQTPDEWRRRTTIFRNRESLSPAPAPPEVDELLRPYQRIGAAWLWHLRRQKLGGILADEMGLGKTLQALVVVAARCREKGTVPCLVVCPASLLENWRREAARFTPELQVHVHHGTDRVKESSPLERAHLVITSYGTLARDQTLFHATEWDTLFADEAQHVKNRRTQNAHALQGVHAGSRILLTGTPVENSLSDLESLFAVILPGYLKSIPSEARGEARQWHEARLRRQAAPYILRRTKAQVTPELPPKIEQTVFVELTDDQRALYEKTRVKTESEFMQLELAGRSEGSIRMAMFTQLLRLRQICGDPRLVDPANDSANSAKLAALMELLEEAADDGHRVLVFSQFTSLLALVRAELDAQQIGYCYLDGSMPAHTRQAEVDRFNEDASTGVFLLSLKAGGTGLNLATADTVVHYDPWWNPAVEAQATDRAHRIGQTRLVTSYKLIAAGTVEERVLTMQNDKRALLANVFEEADVLNAALTIDDMKGLLASP